MLDTPAKLINAVKELLPQNWKSGHPKIDWPDRFVPQRWLNDFIAYRQRWNVNYNQLQGIPLIEVQSGRRNYLWKVSMSNRPLLTDYRSDRISEEMNIEM